MSTLTTPVGTEADAAAAWAHGLFDFWDEQRAPATLSGTELLALARAYDASQDREGPDEGDVIALLCACGAHCTVDESGRDEIDADRTEQDAAHGIPPSRLLITRPDSIQPADPVPRDRAAGAAEQQSHLLRAALERMKRRRIESDTEGLPPPAPEKGGSDAAVPRLRSRLWRRRKTIIKTLVALALAFVFMWLPVQRLLSTTSAQATVNARIVTLRAPIDGIVSSQINGLELGQPVAGGHLLLTIDNPRAERATLDQLERQRETLLTSIAVAKVRKAALDKRIAAMRAQTARFQRGRMRKLLKQVGAVDAELAAARSSQVVAADALGRARRLIASGVISRTSLDTAVDAATRARQRVAQLVQQRSEIEVEIGFLRRGTYVGDSYNDMPASERQRLDDLLHRDETAARLMRLESELASLESRLTLEMRQFAIRAKATVPAPTGGRVWEILVAPGEQVTRGQDLVRLVDCSSAFVTAAVSETVYQRLFIGQQAQFRPRGGGADIDGWVIGLNGLASVRSSAAIAQKALDREPYKATIKFPALTHGGKCHIGRSGIVTFGTKARIHGSASQAGAGN